MNKYREIVTKAVIAKGRKLYPTSHILVPDKSASKVLGCWIIAHQCQGKLVESNLMIEGSYQIHLWYGYNDNCSSDILVRTITYNEQMPYKIKSGETINSETEIKISCSKYPVCTSLKLLDESHIEVNVEKEITFDGIGDAVLKVQISDNFEDEFVLDQEIDKNVDVNYFKS